MTLADLRALCGRATKGPWRSVRNSQRPYKHVIFDGKPDRDAMYTTSPLEATDADFIAAARTWLPALIEVAEAAEYLRNTTRGIPVGIPAHAGILDALQGAETTMDAALARLDEMERT